MLTRPLILSLGLMSALIPTPAVASDPLLPPAEPTVLTSARDPQWSETGFDPILVLFSSGGCESRVVDVELWSRDQEAWAPHPRHPRLVTGGCEVEDAGKLLNEIRIRCADPTGERDASPWRVGVNVWRPLGESACLADVAPRSPLRVSILSPGPGEVIRAERGLTTLRGIIETSARLDVEERPNREDRFLAGQSQPGLLADVGRVRIDNLSTGEFSEDVILEPGGHFSGSAPVASGVNHLRVSVVGRDGRFGSAELEIEFRRPDEREEVLAAERERMRRVRAQQQKSLELSVEPAATAD